jgi:hypothetical protein
VGGTTVATDAENGNMAGLPADHEVTSANVRIRVGDEQIAGQDPQFGELARGNLEGDRTTTGPSAVDRNARR